MLERFQARGMRESRRRFRAVGDVAITYAGALGDPFVGGVDLRRQFGIADRALGESRTDSGDN